MWFNEKYEVWNTINELAEWINNWAKKSCELLCMVIENEHRIRELEKEIKKLKEGGLNEKSLSRKKNIKKQIRNKERKL